LKGDEGQPRRDGGLSRIEHGQLPVEAEIKTCLVKVEAAYLEANPEEIKSLAVREEVPTEVATVKTVRALKKPAWGLASSRKTPI
jgi:hypothetical protein